jgi:hypothetical protein
MEITDVSCAEALDEVFFDTTSGHANDIDHLVFAQELDNFPHAARD